MEHDLLGERSPVAAVAFKYLKKAKHRSDMQPAKKMRTHEKVLPFQEKAFSADCGHVT